MKKLSPKAQAPVNLVAFFFSGCRNPFNISDVITSLAAGRQLQAERLPSELLPCVVLLSTIGLRSFNQQIVDDYEVLLDRMGEMFKAPDHSLNYWHPQLNLVALICDDGPRGQYWLDGCPDAAYMYAVYEYLVNNTLEELFAA